MKEIGKALGALLLVGVTLCVFGIFFLIALVYTDGIPKKATFDHSTHLVDGVDLCEEWHKNW